VSPVKLSVGVLKQFVVSWAIFSFCVRVQMLINF
jgi:hypothetical protein